MSDMPDPAHEHEWQPGPVIRWASVTPTEVNVPAAYATGGVATDVMVVCRCGAWRSMPLTGRYRGEVGP